MAPLVPFHISLENSCLYYTKIFDNVNIIKGENYENQKNTAQRVEP